MSKSNPFAAPQALVETPGALEAIAEAAANATPRPPNHDAPARIDSGAEPVDLIGDGTNQFGGIPADGNPHGEEPLREDAADNGAEALSQEASRAADATTPDQVGDSARVPSNTPEEATTGDDEASDDEEDEDEAPVAVNANSHKLDELQAMARAEGLDDSGTKGDLADRINEKRGVSE
jgi:hypothetical protein